MNGLELAENSASYMSKVDDSILITSPTYITKYTNGQLVIHLRGLLKPDTRLSIHFTPWHNILAAKLDWTLDGAIVYFHVMKDKLIHVGHRIGTIHWQPFEQPGKMQTSSHSIKFHT